MRRAYYDVGWMLDDAGRLQGVNLGYDRCAEHEWGIDTMLAAFGVPKLEFPLGVGDRTITRVPDRLKLVAYAAKPRDRRRKAYPAMCLSLLDPWEHELDRGLDNTVKAHSLEFVGELSDRNHRECDDIVASYSQSGFALNVRGEANIARLKELLAAFDAKDIAIAVPWAKSFFRGGLAFVIASRMPQEAKAETLASDEAHRELQLAVQATGIHDTLEAAGRRFYGLAPDWFDDSKDELLFFLNPCEQKRYNFGWFTLADLQAWCEDKGPVVTDSTLVEYSKRPENYNWACRLLRGMNKAGIKLRHHHHLVWADEAKTVPGLRHRATRDTEALLASGNYSFDELMQRYAEPLEQSAVV